MVRKGAKAAKRAKSGKGSNAGNAGNVGKVGTGGKGDNANVQNTERANAVMKTEATEAIESTEATKVPEAKVMETRVEKSSMKNKTRVLVMSTRGVTTRFRHLMEDMLKLLPHAKKESKLDGKDRLEVATEVAELRNCDTILLFESRKRQDLYLWMSKSPFGPSLKMYVANVHTMEELGFPGNNLMFSRALLTFDAEFDKSPMLRLIKELLQHVFAAPAEHRRTKPFVDHVVSFSLLDGRIWLRHYQVVDSALDEKAVDRSVESTLVEIGPRLVMAPIKCFSGAFRGAVIWENSSYIGPNEIRRVMRKREGDHTIRRIENKRKRAEHLDNHPIEHDSVHKVFR